MPKITRATVKAFIKRNPTRLLIKNKSDFDGMVDCVIENNSPTFRRARMIPIDEQAVHSTDRDNRLGVAGAWFVGDSRDYFKEYSGNGATGYEVSNCCGSFILAVETMSVRPELGRPIQVV